MPEVLEQFPGALDELKKVIKADEFHFSDLYAGKNKFKDVPLSIRLNLFRFMAEIFQKYKFPVFVQTLDSDTLDDLRKRGLESLPKN